MIRDKKKGEMIKTILKAIRESIKIRKQKR